MPRHSPQPALLEQHPCHIARAAVYQLLLSSQDSVDADVDQTLIPPSIFAPGGKHGGYGTWQLMPSEEGFQAAQNVYWWLPSDESAGTSIYLVCHLLHLCTGILVLLLLRYVSECSILLQEDSSLRYEVVVRTNVHKSESFSDAEYPRSCITAEDGMSKQQIVANRTSQHSLHTVDSSIVGSSLFRT